MKKRNAHAMRHRSQRGGDPLAFAIIGVVLMFAAIFAFATP